MSSYLDGGVIYGTSRMWTNHLRSFKDGGLMADSGVFTTSFPYLNTRRLPLHNAPPPRDHQRKPVTRLFGQWGQRVVTLVSRLRLSQSCRRVGRATFVVKTGWAQSQEVRGERELLSNCFQSSPE